MPEKIATCCYCGRRTALKLNRMRHELSCGGCGAPLSELKRLPSYRSGPRELVALNRVRAHSPEEIEAWGRKKKTKKPRKSFLRMALEEVLDAVEDVFD